MRIIILLLYYSYLSEYLFKPVNCNVHLRPGMGCHKGETDEHGILRYRRGDHRSDEYAFVKGELHNLECLGGIPYKQGDDRRLSVSGIKSACLELLLGIMGYIPKVLYALRRLRLPEAYLH